MKIGWTWARVVLASGLVLGPLGLTPSASAALPVLSDGFELGALSGWSDIGNVSVGSTWAHDGRYGARLITTATQDGQLSWGKSVLAQGQRYARVSGWVRVVSVATDQNAGILSVKNAYGSNHFDLWRDAATGKFRWDLLSTNNAYSSAPANLGQWYFIEVLVDYGGSAGSTYTARVRIDGVDQTSITSTGRVGTTVQSFWFGSDNTAQTGNVRDYDTLQGLVGSSPLSYAS